MLEFNLAYQQNVRFRFWLIAATTLLWFHSDVMAVVWTAPCLSALACILRPPLLRRADADFLSPSDSVNHNLFSAFVGRLCSVASRKSLARLFPVNLKDFNLFTRHSEVNCFGCFGYCQTTESFASRWSLSCLMSGKHLGEPFGPKANDEASECRY